MTALGPEDEHFRVRSSDRMLTDRLLSDPKAREAISAALAGPSDEVSLNHGRFIARRRFGRKDSPEPAITQSLAALREMTRVLG